MVYLKFCGNNAEVFLDTNMANFNITTPFKLGSSRVYKSMFRKVLKVVLQLLPTQNKTYSQINNDVMITDPKNQFQVYLVLIWLR